MTDGAIAFGPRLRELRLAADLTLEQLAERSGVSDRAISDMERGVSQGPQARTVQAIADALGLGADDRAELAAAARAGRRRSAGPVTWGRCPLPRRVIDFAGRRDELAAIRARLTAAGAGDPAPVVLLSGAPGMGKTSLAVQAATELADPMPDGRFFVDLRGLDDRPLTAAQVLERLIHAIDPSVGAVPQDLDELSALWRTRVDGRRVVVVLDNAAGDGQVRPVLPGTGPAAVLVTSRRTLSGLEGVHRIPLGPLPDAAAVTLLAGIVAGPPERAAGLDRLARLCANTPLALRIAGNRLASRPGWTVGDLADRLGAEERRLDALTAGDLQVKAAFRLSYQQLSGVGRRLFRRLALVPGPSTGAELAAVLAEESLVGTEDALDELIDLGLLQHGADDRYSLHDLLRLYADLELRQEESADDRRAARRRAVDWLLDTTVVAGRWYEPGFGAPPPDATRLVGFDTADAARDWLQAEAENWLPALVQAAAAGAHQRVIDVAESLHWFSDLWPHWGHWHEVFALSVEAADRLDDDHLRAVHLGYLAWAHISCRGEFDVGFRHAERAAECAGRAGDARQQGWARFYCAWARLEAGRYADALAYARESADRFRQARDWDGLPQALLGIGQSLGGLERDDEAVAAYQEVTAVVRSPETAPSEQVAQIADVMAARMTARLHRRHGRWSEAKDLIDGALDLAERLRLLRVVAWALVDRADAFLGLGDPVAAAADLRRAVAVHREIGDESQARQLQDRLDRMPAPDPPQEP
ncbi:helix-turn-helix domain-containing protein [Micromonospora sp. NPDC018662]|uniref:helix-turn-helix domain-containing protein n=1 Tax=Micromonospora sp. NPDC018662 TaxID=3364238 RepID=UPI003790FF31